MLETPITQRIRLDAPHIGAAMWRNNNGACLDSTGRMIRYGLGNDSARLNKLWKSSDLFGILSVTIQPEHVGRVAGIALACEVKPTNWTGALDDHTRAQAAFLQTVRDMGGIGFFARSVEEFKAGARW